MVFQATPAKNVCPPQNLLLDSQISVALFYVRTVKFVRARTFADDLHLSRLQERGRRHHLSQSIGPAVAGSAGPARCPSVVPGQLAAFLAILSVTMRSVIVK